jgi:hypothetical protein
MTRNAQPANRNLAATCLQAPSLAEQPSGFVHQLVLECAGFHSSCAGAANALGQAAFVQTEGKIITRGRRQTGQPVMPITLRLYKTSFANPHPRWVIATVDIESLFTHATPVVVAITIGKPGEGVKRSHVAPTSLTGRFTERMVVKDAKTGKPVSGAQVQFVLSDGERDYSFGEQTTDVAGRTVLECSREQISRLSVSVSAPGYTTLGLTMNILDLPPELELKLEAQLH